MENLLNSGQVAEKLGMSEVWVYKEAEKGLLPYYRVGDALRFDPDDIRAYLNQRKGIKRIYGRSRNPKGRKKETIHLVGKQEGAVSH